MKYLCGFEIESRNFISPDVNFDPVAQCNTHTIFTYPGKNPKELQAPEVSMCLPQSSSSKHDDPEHPHLPDQIPSYHS